MNEKIDAHAVPLYRKGSVEPAAWYCSGCGHVLGDEHSAEQHCDPRTCSDCGEKYDPGSYWCRPCTNDACLKRSAKIWEKATPVDAKDWDGQIYVEDGYQNQLFGDGWSNLDELRDWLDDWRAEHPGEEDPVIHVYASTEHKATFSAEHIVEQAMEDYLDGCSAILQSAYDELDALLKDWSDRRSPTWCMPDDSRKIVNWKDDG